MQPKLHRVGAINPVRLLFTPGLPSQVWLLQAGVALNFFGNGLVAPYLVIYLHLVRGIPLAIAALAIGSGGILATVSGLVAGPLIDRFGPRTCVSLAMTGNAMAYASYTLVHTSWQAFAVGLAVGIGTGAYGPSVQALLAGIVRPDQRAAALSQQRMSAIIGLSLGGLAGGLIVATGSPDGYTLILLLDSATFFGFAALVRLLPSGTAAGSRSSGEYRIAIRDRKLRFLAVVNLVMVGAGIAPMMLLLPAFARGTANVPAAAIGLIYAVNTLVILVTQLRITRAVAIMRPRTSLAIGAIAWAAAWSLIATTGWLLQGWLAAGLLAMAMAVYALGECIYTGVVTPTAAAMAPENLRGRYLAVMGFAWQAGFMIGPPAGAAMFGLAPLAFPMVAAAVCAGLAMSLGRFGHRLDQARPATSMAR
jgi:MFS family permease